MNSKELSELGQYILHHNSDVNTYISEEYEPLDTGENDRLWVLLSKWAIRGLEASDDSELEPLDERLQFIVVSIGNTLARYWKFRREVARRSDVPYILEILDDTSELSPRIAPKPLPDLSVGGYYALRALIEIAREAETSRRPINA